jgi:hypothetical protein
MIRAAAWFTAAFLTGAYVALWWVDHVLGGSGPRVVWDEPGGGW